MRNSQMMAGNITIDDAEIVSMGRSRTSADTKGGTVYGTGWGDAVASNHIRDGGIKSALHSFKFGCLGNIKEV